MGAQKKREEKFCLAVSRDKKFNAKESVRIKKLAVYFMEMVCAWLVRPSLSPVAHLLSLCRRVGRFGAPSKMKKKEQKKKTPKCSYTASPHRRDTHCRLHVL